MSGVISVSKAKVDVTLFMSIHPFLFCVEPYLSHLHGLMWKSKDYIPSNFLIVEDIIFMLQ